jgi:putative oxidoreductase
MARDVSLLPARASLGATMIYHGVSKLRGEGPAQTAGFFEQIGIRPGARWARLAGIAEVAAGASAILGIGTGVGAAIVLATQAVAVAKVHAPKGFSNLSGGYEFNALLAAVALGLLVAGPGRISAHEAVEHGLEGRRTWRGWRLPPTRRGAAVRFAKLLK